MNTQHKVVSIKVTWSEHAEIAALTSPFASFAEINMALGPIPSKIPAELGGYEKTGYEVTFGDGSVYRGRLDVTRTNFKVNDSARWNLAFSLKHGYGDRAELQTMLENYCWD